MFEAFAFMVYFIIGVGVVEEVVIPSAKYTNETYVQPSVDYVEELYKDYKEKSE